MRFIVVMNLAATDEVWTWYTVIVACKSEFSSALVEIEDRHIVRVLIGNEKILARVVKLEVSWSLASSVEVSNRA